MTCLGISEPVVVLLSQFLLLVAVLIDPWILFSQAQKDVVELVINLVMPVLQPIPQTLKGIGAWFAFHTKRKVLLL